MIDDPDDPDYRYPLPGERYWHVLWRRWVVVRDADSGVSDEVAVTFEDTGRDAIVKLRSLEDDEVGPVQAITLRW